MIVLISREFDEYLSRYIEFAQVLAIKLLSQSRIDVQLLKILGAGLSIHLVGRHWFSICFFVFFVWFF